MANASAEKFKALGLRHGEKAVMGVAAALSLLFLFQAMTRETIQTTPEDVKKAAEQADSNLKRKQEPDDILKKLEEAGIKNPNFEKLVDEQSKNQLSSSTFKVKTAWATPEPGAGLIRDTPVLLAPTNLVAYPGRGGALVFDTKDGERIPETPEDAAKAEEARSKASKSRRNRRGSAMASADPGMGTARPKTAAELKKEELAYEKAKKAVASKLSGKDTSKSDKPEEAAKYAGPFKETTRGLRWVVITGTLDYKTLRENYMTALKRKEVAYPHFRTLGVQRQALQGDGSWSEWEDVDAEKNAEVLNNLPEVDEEWVPEANRLEALVDPLPFLRAGYWEKVHVASLVPKEKKEVAKPTFTAAGPGMGMDMATEMSRQQMMMEQQQMMSMDQTAMMGMAGAGMSGMSGPSGPVEDMNFPKNEEETLMIRSLDFTVDPDTTYRFRVRLVVFNPNYNREDVSAGTNTKDLELFGPWSKETEEVTVPPDVATYAMGNAKNALQGDQVKFQVTKWDPSNGVMVVRSFDAGAGGIVGERQLADIPTSDGSKPDKKLVDFSSQRIVLDTLGGDKRIPRTIDNGLFSSPAVALVVRPDGAVVIRNMAFDESDEVRKTIESSYKRELDESGKERVSASGPAAAP